MDIIMTVTLKDDTEAIGFKKTSGKTVQQNKAVRKYNVFLSQSY